MTKRLFRGCLRVVRRFYQGLSDSLISASLVVIRCFSLGTGAGFCNCQTCKSPLISIIILNYNKPNLTEKCVNAVHKHSEGTLFELIVVDNGSTAVSYLSLVIRVRLRCKLLRLPVNCYFGEGNNIAADVATGHYLVFLNNDAFVTAGWLGPLLQQIEADPTIGYIGPKFVYPDGRLQEVGGRVEKNGHVTQFGKSIAPVPEDLSLARDVEYCSAACAVIERSVFLSVGGFSAAYEPAYYEDVDLCRRVLDLGYRVVCEPRSTVVHLENATSTDDRVFKRTPLQNITELNREKFLARWGHTIGDVGTVQTRNKNTSARKRTVVFVTDRRLEQTNNIQYFIAAALAAEQDYHVVIATEQLSSYSRLIYLMDCFGFDARRIELRTIADVGGVGGIAATVAMGRGPQIGGPRVQLYCDVESLPLDSMQRGTGVTVSEGARRVIVNQAYDFRRPSPSIQIIAPRLGITRDLGMSRRNRPLSVKGSIARIVSIDSFSELKLDSSVDFMIDVATRLAGIGFEFALDIVGHLPQGMDYHANFLRLRERGSAVRTVLHPDPHPAFMRQLLSDAHYSWGVRDTASQPDGSRSFRDLTDLNILQPMSFGVVPFFQNCDSYSEVCTDGINGIAFCSQEDLVQRVASFSLEASGRFEEMSAAAMVRSKDFDGLNFDMAWRELLREVIDNS